MAVASGVLTQTRDHRCRCLATGGGAVHALARAENDRVCLSGSTPRACRRTGRFAHCGQLAPAALRAGNKRSDKKEVDPNPSAAKVATRKISHDLRDLNSLRAGAMTGGRRLQRQGLWGPEPAKKG